MNDTNKVTETKCIAWAYPSSTHATKFGFGKSGCWVVEIVYRGEKCGKPPRAIRGFSDKEQAWEYANGLSQPWNGIQ